MGRSRSEQTSRIRGKNTRPDLLPRLVDDCADECICDSPPSGSIEFSVEVDKLGSMDQPEGALLRLYTKPEEGCLEEVLASPLPSIPARWSTDALRLEVPAEQWGSRQVLEVWHDVPFLHPERDCDLVNNRSPVELDLCPRGAVGVFGANVDVQADAGARAEALPGPVHEAS